MTVALHWDDAHRLWAFRNERNRFSSCVALSDCRFVWLTCETKSPWAWIEGEMVEIEGIESYPHEVKFDRGQKCFTVGGEPVWSADRCLFRVVNRWWEVWCDGPSARKENP